MLFQENALIFNHYYFFKIMIILSLRLELSQFIHVPLWVAVEVKKLLDTA